MKYWHLFLYLFIFFAANTVAAQNPVFTISGKASDKSGAPVSDAVVVVDSSSLHTQTDSAGRYVLKNVPAGTRKITIYSLGYTYQSHTVTGTEGGLIMLNFSLEDDILTMDEVTVVSQSEKERMESSAKAVHVVETKEAKLKSADMGEVLAQTQGVSVRRSGGLGSGTRFSLNGLTGDQIRFFLDGVPLEFSGYTFGISTVPVNLVDRVEIYKGVVPIQFGADALGGAVNIVSPKVRYGFHGSVSYQTGSFGTHRVALDVKYLDDSTGLFISGGGFYDYAKNNYKVEMDVPNEKGKLKPTDIHRFHDAYNAQGINFTLGIKNKSWAKELSVKGFYTGYAKEVQHNLTMEGIFYGDVMTLRSSAGGNLTYRQDFGNKFSLHSVTGFSYSEREFIDTSRFAYDYYGNHIYVDDSILIKSIPGEVVRNVNTSSANHILTWDQNVYSRIFSEWNFLSNHKLRLTIAPTYTYRTGKENYANTNIVPAPIGQMLTWVNGIEYEVNACDQKLQNIFFVKNYIQRVSIEERMSNLPEPLVTQRNVNSYGLGNGLRYQFTERLSTKASYEYAIRLPRPDELFGDGQFIANNLGLKPERSQNINLEFTYKSKFDSKRKWFVQSNLFLRNIRDLIFFHFGATDLDNVYKNLADAISKGVEINTGWTSPEEKINITFNSTFQYYYNNSTKGEYKPFRFDRMPNSPYFFINGSASYVFKNIFTKNSRLSPFLNLRYVHKFYRNWESAGNKNAKEFKHEIPGQQIHGAGITYRILFEKHTWALTGEVQNLLNKKVYDFYGVQKAGRAYYMKMILQF